MPALGDCQLGTSFATLALHWNSEWKYWFIAFLQAKLVMPSWKHVDTNPPPNPPRLWTWFFWAISTKVRWCVELNLWGHDDLRLEAGSDKQRGISIQAAASQSFARIDCRYAIAEVPKPFETAVPSWLVWQRWECWVARKWVDLKDMGSWDCKETTETLDFDHGLLLMCCIPESSNFHEWFCRMLKSEPGPSPATTPGSKNEAIEVPHRVAWPKFQKPTLSSLAILKFQHSFLVWCKRRESWGVGDWHLCYFWESNSYRWYCGVFADYSRICDLILPTHGREMLHSWCQPELQPTFREVPGIT